MNRQQLRLLAAAMCATPLLGLAQPGHPVPFSDPLFQEAKSLYQDKNYAAAYPLLETFLSRRSPESLSVQADYMLATSAYALHDSQRVSLLRRHLERYPDTPYANRVYALLASCFYYEADYAEALALFSHSDLSLLSDAERDEFTYQLALCYLETGDLSEAAVWFETLRASSKSYADDCTYHLSYIRYTQQRYDEALPGFLRLQGDSKYGELAPYYIAEIYALRRNYDKSQIVAEGYLSSYPDNEHSAEMYRILGDAYYHFGKYAQAVKAFSFYTERTALPRRDALYMLGLSYYQTGVYSKAVETLGQVLTQPDALTQNANYHLGLAYLQLADKGKARMAFEQAAASDADMKVKEQASYNYALCVHETAYSAFGESVAAFERFLNEFPTSAYADRISDYLVDVYMTTRSYEAALSSIDRISRPSTRVLEAKQKILFQLGTQTFANADFEKALGYLNKSIELGQYNAQTKAESYYWCGEAYYRLNRLNEAARDFNAYLRFAASQKKTEMYALAHYNLGYIAFHQKNYAQASNYFSQYVRLEQGENQSALADAYNRLGDCSLNARDFDTAKQYYAQAEQSDNAVGDYSFYQLAFVCGLQNDYSGKITLLNRMLGKYPSSSYAVNALYEKGRAYVSMENNAQAITSFKELVEKYPENPVSRKAAAEIGLLHYQNGEYAQAIDAYKLVIEKYPGSEEARLAMRDLKSIYVDTNRIDEFAELTATMPGGIRLETNEQDSLTYAAAEKIYMRGRTEEAKQSFDKYLQNFPQGAFSLNAHYYLCVIAYGQKSYDEVLAHSDELLRFPDNPFVEEALVMRAEIQFNKMQMAEALASYKLLKEKASSTDRRLLAETGILRCAHVLKEDAETVQAATDLLSEAKLTPELQNEALYYRAKALLKLGNSDKAMTDLRLLSKDTRNLYGAEAKYLLAQTLYDAGKYAEAEKELLNYIEQSTPHAYWLARGFILLSDVYVAMGKELDARQYLLSLQQNYSEDPNINEMVESRLEKLNQPKTETNQ